LELVEAAAIAEESLGRAEAAEMRSFEAELRAEDLNCQLEDLQFQLEEALEARRHLEVELEMRAAERSVQEWSESSAHGESILSRDGVTEATETSWLTNADVGAAAVAQLETRVADLEGALEGAREREAELANGAAMATTAAAEAASAQAHLTSLMEARQAEGSEREGQMTARLHSAQQEAEAAAAAAAEREAQLVEARRQLEATERQLAEAEVKLAQSGEVRE
jgi:hypothetical protein